MTNNDHEMALRLLARLARRDRTLIKQADGRFSVLVATSDTATRTEAADPHMVAHLITTGLVTVDSRGHLAVSAAGRAALRRRMVAASDGYAEQHQDRGAIMLDDAAFGRRRVTVNHDESPLAWLRHRKDGSGRALIDANEFAAGERLRVDYERAHLMPRVTANWTAAVASGRRSGDNAIAMLTESALGARRRVEAALEALEPELADLAVDFCCFLKGLEQIERERQWPARSAKVVLRLTLAALARHYGLSTRACGPDSARTRHWGGEGYRPKVD